MFVHAAVLTDTLRHAEELHELCPVAKAATLVNNIRRRPEQDAEVVVCSELNDQVVAIIRNAVFIFFMDGDLFRFRTDMFTGDRTEGELCCKVELIDSDSPKTGQHNVA